jgi:hypothetical protein
MTPPSAPCRFLYPETSRLAEPSEASAPASPRMRCTPSTIPRETTAKGRAAFLARFDREVDPEGLLEPDERRRRAEQARRAYFARLSLTAVKARQAKRAARAQPPEDGTAA